MNRFLMVVAGLLPSSSAGAVAAAVTPARLTQVPGSDGALTMVYLHGVYHGGWSFSELHPLLAPLAKEQYLLDLRGHHGAERITPDAAVGYADYLQDVHTLLDQLPGKKLLVGHSLGGLLSISSLGRDDINGAVLLATPLPEVICSKRWWLLLRYPIKSFYMVTRRDAAPFYHDKAWARRYFFTKDTAQPLLDRAFENISQQDEPFQLFDDINDLSINVSDVRKAVLVIAGSEDPTVDKAAATTLAGRFGRKPVMVNGAGHDLMLEPNHAKTASEHIADWLTRDLPSSIEEEEL